MGSIVFQDESREISTDPSFTCLPKLLEISMITLVNKTMIQCSPLHLSKDQVAGTDIAFIQPHIQFRPI